jgi:hypothetical protein
MVAGLEPRDHGERLALRAKGLVLPCASATGARASALNQPLMVFRVVRAVRERGAGRQALWEL